MLTSLQIFERISRLGYLAKTSEYLIKDLTLIFANLVLNVKLLCKAWMIERFAKVHLKFNKLATFLFKLLIASVTE